MRNCIALLFVLAGLAHGQVAAIAAGSLVAIPPYTADQFFTGGTARPKDTSIGSGIYQTTRYGADFSYHIPVPIGFYGVTLRLSDPTSTAAGQRVFTVIVNGSNPGPIDIFAAVGARKPYTLDLTALAGAGFIDVTFHALKGNATVSGIDVQPMLVMVGLSNGSTVVSALLQSSNQVGSVPCPAGWTAPRLNDGSCLAVFLTNLTLAPGSSSATTVITVTPNLEANPK